jgi:hypothetical protein
MPNKLRKARLCKGEKKEMLLFKLRKNLRRLGKKCHCQQCKFRVGDLSLKGTWSWGWF